MNANVTAQVLSPISANIDRIPWPIHILYDMNNQPGKGETEGNDGSPTQNGDEASKAADSEKV